MFVNFNMTGMAGNGVFKHTINSQGYKFGDIPLYGGAAELDWALRGLRFQLEFSYQTGDMTDITFNTKGKPAFAYDRTKFDDEIKVMTGTFYIGTTIFPCKRFQIPLYAGFGVENIKGYPHKNTSFSFSFKGRLLLYLTKNVGLFAGYKYKMSAKENEKPDFEGLSSTDKLEYSNNYHFAEAGLTIMLGRMGGNKQ